MMKSKAYSWQMICITAVMAMAVSDKAMSNPLDGVVSGGQATINQAGNKLEIRQNTDKAVIDWRKFDIQANEHTEFKQPNSNSITLNRVHSNTASKIDGKLTANGNVVIVNQNGVMILKL